MNKMSDPSFKATMAQCMMALVSTATVAVCVCVGVTMNLIKVFDVNFDHMGIRTFCMFTVNSNILTGLSMLMALPYTIDGLRTGHYHLPNWVVKFMFASVTAVALTFLVSLFILAPAKGFVLIFTGSRFFLHGVCPILAILTFVFFVCDHYVTHREIVWALIPVLLYAVVYFMMVVVIGPDNGGWDDFYGFATRIPVWISIIMITPVTVGIATLLRLGHNHFCMRRRQKDAELYRQTCGKYAIRDIVRYMARARRKFTNTADIVIPARTIWHLIENSGGTDMTLKEGSKLYLNTFLEDGTVTEQIDIIEAEQV